MTTNQTFEQDELDPRRTLDGAEREDALAAMRRAAPPDFVPMTLEIPAEPRWGDVPAAMATACTAREMAVVSTLSEPDRYRFEVKTLINRPGEFVVERTTAPPGYRVSGWMGLFRNDRVGFEELELAFHDAMEAYRLKPQVGDLRPAGGGAGESP